MLSCAAAAIAAVALAPQKAGAQAFAGTPTTAAGTVSFDSRTNPNVETITIGSPTATIDWSPSLVLNGNGNIDFLPATNIATFQGDAAAGNYTVLNRILPDGTYAIELNGTVKSFVNGGGTGGNIWFYSPGGILVGGSAVFDVGGLLLTTNPVTFTTDADGFSATFTAGPSTSKIEVDPNAQINALAQNSYVALVAPRIEQGGDVRVNGSTAFVAAEQLTMTMNQGLFDIQVAVGTDDPNGVVHTGSTTGLANESLDGSNRMYLVAVPKNQAMSILLGGTIGYEATTAGEVNGEIVLGSGTLGIDDIVDPYTSVTISDSDSNIAIDDVHFTSSVRGMVMNLAQINTSAGDVTFDGDLSMESFYGDISMIADGRAIAALGNVSLNASPVDFPPSSGDSEDRIGGNIQVHAINGGTINTQSLTLDAKGKGQDNSGNGDTVAGDGTGGTIDIFADSGGSITVDGNLNGTADGRGGDMLDGATQGGAGSAGNIWLTALNGTIHVIGDTSLTANGTGGGYQGSLTPTTAQGGTAFGGNIWVNVDGSGSVSIGGTSTLQANATGGDAGVDGGDATGGVASVNVNGSGSADFGDVLVSAYAAAGSGETGSGGDAIGGRATIGGSGGAIHITGDLTVDGSARGGNGASGGSAQGFISPPEDESQPVAATIYAINGASITVDGNAVMVASAEGGDATDGSGGNATAGEVDVIAFVGDISLGTLDLSADAIGGDGANGGSGGNAIAGAGDVTFGLGGQAVEGTITIGTATLSASAFGGAGGAGADGNFGGAGGTGGNAEGGGITFAGHAAGGMLISDDTTIAVTATGGAGGAGGNGDSGTGGDGGAGGTAQGGFIQTGTISGSGAPLAGGGGVQHTSLSLDSSATGGNGGGAGFGGGGDGTGGAGGDASGGSASFLIRGVTGSVDTLTLAANATGGNGGAGTFQGNGGSATTGGVAVESKDRFDHPDQRGSLTAGTITGTAIATGGTGAIDGASLLGFGSSVNFSNGDATIDSLSFTVAADSLGTNSSPSFIQAIDADVIFTGDLSFSTAGELALVAYDSVLHANAINLSAGNFVPDGEAPVGAAGTVTANTFDITTDQNFVTNATLHSTSDLNLSAPGSITVGTLQGASAINLDAGTTITASSITALGSVGLDAVTVIANGGTISAGQDITVDADITSSSSLTIYALGDISINGVSANNAIFTAGDTANFYGIVSAPTITVTSADLNIADGGALGVWGTTNLLTLNAVSNGNPVYVGGPEGQPVEGSYTLSEAGDISATNVVVNAVAGTESPPPDVVMGDLFIEGTDSQGVSHVTVNTGGSVLINNQVYFVDATAGDSLSINAGDRIELVTDTGGLYMVNTAENPAGTLNLTAHDIWIADQSVLSQLEENPNFSGLQAALATNNGEVNPIGYVAAGGINVMMLGSSFLVQNTGTADQPAGLTVGDGGLSLVNQGSSPATVIAYGQQVTSGGTTNSGNAFLGSVSATGSGGYSTTSTINGCPVSGCSVTPPPPPPPPPVEPPPPPPPPDDDSSPPPVFSSESILGPIDMMNSPSDESSDEGNDDDDEGDEDSGNGGTDAGFQLINMTPLTPDQSVDTPVTSGSDGPGL